MKIRKLLAVMLFSLLVPTCAFAELAQYRVGSMIFGFKAGTSMPAFDYFWDSESNTDYDFYWLWGGEAGDHRTKLKWGGYFSLEFERFINSKLSLGGELGYDFNYVIDDQLYTSIPVFFKVTYYPVSGRIDIPLMLGIGTTYERYGDEKSLLTPFLIVETGITVYPWEKWGFGVQSGLMLTPEFNYQDEYKHDNNILGMVPITVSVQYRTN